MKEHALHFMEPVIKQLPEKKLVGISMKMSLAGNKTFELWRSFMPRRKEIVNAVNPTCLYSLQVYDPAYSFSTIDPGALFEKKALVEVNDFAHVPEGMEAFVLPAGLYAIFHYKGDTSGAPQAFGHIFGTWVPASGYQIDNRPHFEILGEHYKHSSPDSEEDICIPIRNGP